MAQTGKFSNFYFFWFFVNNSLKNYPNWKCRECFEKFRKFASRLAQKFPKLMEILPFFGDDIFQLFCCLNGWKVPKSKSPKTNRKHLNIPCLQALTLGHIIKNDSYSTLNCKAFCVTDSVVCFQLVLCANWSVQVLVHHAGLLILGTSYGRVLQFGHWCYVWRIHNKREPVKIQPWNNQYMRSFETCWHL